jgi:hypothetical protein
MCTVAVRPMPSRAVRPTPSVVERLTGEARIRISITSATQPLKLGPGRIQVSSLASTHGPDHPRSEQVRKASHLDETEGQF